MASCTPSSRLSPPAGTASDGLHPFRAPASRCARLLAALPGAAARHGGARRSACPPGRCSPCCTRSLTLLTHLTRFPVASLLGAAMCSVAAAGAGVHAASPPLHRAAAGGPCCACAAAGRAQPWEFWERDTPPANAALAMHAPYQAALLLQQAQASGGDAAHPSAGGGDPVPAGGAGGGRQPALHFAASCAAAGRAASAAGARAGRA